MAQFATGTYTGDGNATQGINGVGFQPTALFIYGHVAGGGTGAIFSGFKSVDDGTYTYYPNTGGPKSEYEEDQIISLDADGFTVGDGTGSDYGNVYNVDDRVYTYIAFAAQGATSMKMGKYTGDGNATFAVNAVGFQPKFVRIMPPVGVDAQAGMAMKTDQDGTYAWIDRLNYNPWWLTDIIVSLDADGFTVGDCTTYPWGNVLNSNGYEYHYVAMA